MNTESHLDRLPMAEALIAWSDPKLIDGIRTAEAELPDGFIVSAGWYRIDDLSQERREPVRSRQIGQPKPVKILLIPLWERVFARFRVKVEKGELLLRGTAKADKAGNPEILPAAMASLYEFDPPSNSVFLPSRSYYGIEVTRGSAPTLSQSDRHPVNAAELTDEEILALLNEHADRVAASPEPKMMARIKDVLQPMILRRLEARWAQKSMAGSLAEEARQLQIWIREVAPWHPIPKPGTIENNIRDTYNALKARSHPMNP